MGLLDSNRVKIQSQEYSQTLFKSLSNDTSDKVINCEGYNTLILVFTPTTYESSVQITGVSLDLYNKVPSLEYYKVGENSKFNQVNSSTVIIKTGAVREYVVNVSKLKRVKLNVTTSNTGTLTCNYKLTFSSIQDVLPKYSHTHFTVSSGALKIDGNNCISAPVNATGIIYTIIITGDDIDSAITIVNGINITSRCFFVDKNTYIPTQKCLWRKGTYRIFVPVINTNNSIYISLGHDGNNSGSIQCNAEAYFGDAVNGYPCNRYAYLLGFSRLIGGAYWVKNHNYKKFARISFYTNGTNSGVSVVPYFGLRNDINRTTSYQLFQMGQVACKDDGETTIDNKFTLGSTDETWYVNTEKIGWIACGIPTNTPNNLDIYIEYTDDIPSNVLRVISSDEQVVTIGNSSLNVNVEGGSLSPQTLFANEDLVQIFDSNKVAIYKNINSRRLVAGFRNIIVWADRASLAISTDGLDGEQTVIELNSTNFPNLISGSTIERVILMPWTRNAKSAYDGKEWRMNVITNLAQIYHNFPSRSTSNDGTAQSGDEFLFDESVVWELPERFTPVATNTGDDATLIATGKYRYFPGLNDSAYEFHPALNHSNGYGNNGFPAYIDKTNEEGTTVRFSRFCQYKRVNTQDNSFSFMAGCATHTKLSLIGTYKDNQSKQTRICVFATNDGGRQWFCIYEFGASGFRIDGNDQRISRYDESLAGIGGEAFADPITITDNFTSPSSGDFSIIPRSQYTPTADFKEIEKTKKFKWRQPSEVQSIEIDSNNNVIINSTAHHCYNGDVVVFSKNNNNTTDWDWIENEGYGDLSCGNGVVFRVKVLNGSQLQLYADFTNPHNNLHVRHIHSINRCKDGYTVGTGEFYPEGWIFYLPVYQSDAFSRKYPWDTMNFVRLNSTLNSVQRPLGVIVAQDADNTVTVGIDNEYTPVNPAILPEGRTDTIRRSSNGLWRGKLTDFDSQSAFNCIFQSDEVCYLYKKILGIDIYVGQQGHIGISDDNWETHIESRLNETILSGSVPHGSINAVTGGYLIVDNYVIQHKH